jgi:hypothetical protein
MTCTNADWSVSPLKLVIMPPRGDSRLEAITNSLHKIIKDAIPQTIAPTLHKRQYPLEFQTCNSCDWSSCNEDPSMPIFETVPELEGEILIAHHLRPAFSLLVSSWFIYIYTHIHIDMNKAWFENTFNNMTWRALHCATPVAYSPDKRLTAIAAQQLGF